MMSEEPLFAAMHIIYCLFQFYKSLNSIWFYNEVCSDFEANVSLCYHWLISVSDLSKLHPVWFTESATSQMK